MKNLLVLFVAFLLISEISAQYSFETTKSLSCTPVKNQERTGTCWSFATASFLESELIRIGKPEVDLSEMYIVRNIYRDKARNYVLRQGKANFSQGSLSHDLIRAYTLHGALPESAYPGKQADEKHNHSEMEKVLKGMLDGLLKVKKLSPKWMDAVDAVLDVYLGPLPETTKWMGAKVSAMDYGQSLNLQYGDYVNITSFMHHPYYSDFILEIPDNYSNGSFYNLPMEELVAIVDNALDNGYTIAWDGDVSEKGFSAKKGIAILPVDEKREDKFETPGEEVEFDAEQRQREFESFVTTDDHLMHLVGSSKDQNGEKYYLIKTSWGEIGDFKGYLHMSDNYLKMKTISIMVHKDAIPGKIRNKLSL